MEYDNWIDIGTRAIIVRLPLYNANLRVFVWFDAILEFPMGGGVIPTFNAQAVRLWRYQTDLERFFVFLELSFVTLLIYMVLLELFSVRLISVPRGTKRVTYRSKGLEKLTFSSFGTCIFGQTL